MDAGPRRGGLWLRRFVALLLAGLTAPMVTASVAALAISFHDQVWGMTRWWAALARWLEELPFGLAAVAFLAVPFGLLPTLPVLALAFACVRGPARPRDYALAGAAAGAAHTVAGLALRLVDHSPDDPSLAVLLGGFLLTSGRPVAAAATLPGAVAGGALAGLVYAFVIGAMPSRARAVTTSP